MEVLVVDGRGYLRDISPETGKWREPPPGFSLDQRIRFWGLFDDPVPDAPTVYDEFDDVTQLGDEVIDGVPVNHYIGRRLLRGDLNDTLEIWIGKEDRLPRKVIRTTWGGTVQPGDLTILRRETFVFSRFNEALPIPTPPPEESRARR